MQLGAEDVDRIAQRSGGSIETSRTRRVGEHDVPAPVEHYTGIRVVRVEHLLQRRADAIHARDRSTRSPGSGARSPAASNKALRSRSGTSRWSARVRTSSGLGRERPVSTKLRCRGDTPASWARSSWLRWRRPRQSLKSTPTPAVAQWSSWRRRYGGADAWLGLGGEVAEEADDAGETPVGRELHDVEAAERHRAVGARRAPSRSGRTRGARRPQSRAGTCGLGSATARRRTGRRAGRGPAAGSSGGSTSVPPGAQRCLEQRRDGGSGRARRRPPGAGRRPRRAHGLGRVVSDRCGLVIGRSVRCVIG